MEIIGLGIDFKKVIIFYILFHFTLLFVEDRIHYIPQVVSNWENRQGGESFVGFIKSVWRTTFSTTILITTFWVWFFFKFGYLVFLFESIGFFKKEKIILSVCLDALVPIYVLVFLRFLFIVFFNRNFISDMTLIFNAHSTLLKFFLSSIEIFRLFEYCLLFAGFRKKMNVKAIVIILILLPIFFGERIVDFTLGRSR